MLKKGIAFLLALILGVSPVVQVNANSYNSLFKDYMADNEELTYEDTSEITTESMYEDESVYYLEETEKTDTLEESIIEEEGSTEYISLEESDSKETETMEETEVVYSEEESLEESVAETLTEQDSMEDLSAEEEMTVTEMDTHSDIISLNSTMITENIDLRNVTQNASGPGWTWVASTKTFTMNGYNSTGTLLLPKDTTLILTKGSNNYIDLKESLWYEYKSGINCAGNLLVTGLGKLTIEHTIGQAIVVSDGKLKFLETDVSFVNKDSGSGSRAFPETAHIIASNLNIETPTRGYTYLYTKNGVVSGCDLTFGQKGIKYTFDELDNYFGVLNEETGLYQITFQRKPAYATSENNLINEIHIGESITLKVISNSFNGKKGKLQWYKALSYFSPQDAAVKIEGATENTLTVTGENYGVEYYYCEISAGDYQTYSETVAVAIGHEGSKICTQPLTFSKTESVDRLATDGFKWDHTTLTATFSNMDYLYPFFGSNSKRNMKIPAGSTLHFEGNNYAIDNQMQIDDNNQGGLVTKFTGTGTFHIDNIYLFLEESSQIHLTDGISLNVLQFSAGGKGGNLIIDNGSLNADNDVYGNNDIILKNNSALKCGGKLDVEKSLLIGEKCTVFTGGKIIIGANLDIAKDALLTTESVINMDYNNTDNATCVINGTLHIKERTNPEILFSIFSLEENPIILGEDVSILCPQGAEIGNRYPNSNAYKAFVLNGSAYMNELFIGKESYTSQKIKIDKGIYGIPKYGNTLKTGEVTPADAMVSYQWQYAENKEGPWNDISKRTKNTFFVDAKYHGYYLRAVMKGIGTYTGTVISDVVGPIEGDPASLKALYGLGGDPSEVLISNFDGHDFSYSPITSANEDGIYRYYLIPVNENAKIKLYNETTGFEGEGQMIDVPMAEGDNIVRIEVTYGTRTVTYKLEHTIKPTVYYLTFSVYGEASNKLTASFVDSKGISQTVTTTMGHTSNRYGISRGTKVTLTSETAAGKCAYFYGGIPQMADYTKAGSPLTFEVKGSMEVSFGSNNHIGAKRLQGLSAEWLWDQERAIIKVNSNTIDGLSTKNNVTVEIYDEEGTIVETARIPNSTEVDLSGFYQVVTGVLDSSKNYTIKAFNTDLINTDGSDAMDDIQKCNFILEKRREISLSVESEYIVLQPGETVPVKIDYNGYTGSNLWIRSLDPKVLDIANTYISEDENGSKILYICALDEGSTYVTLMGDNYAATGGEEYLYAHVRVDVSSKEEADTFYLGCKKGTINLYDDKAITVPVYSMNCGHKIQSAEFVEEVLNEKFTIHVVNDRTLKILPKVPSNDGTVDYAKWIKQKGTTGTFQSKIRINYNDTYSKDSDEIFSVTVNAKAPEIKSSKLSFSSFYTSQVKQLDIRINGEIIERIEVDKVKTTASKVACPDWLSFVDEKGTISFDGNSFPDKKTNTYLYLQVWPKGYFVPLQTKVKVSVDYSMPTLVPSQKPYWISRNKETNTSFSFTFNSGDKNVSYKDLGVNNIRLISERDFAFLNKAECNRLKLSKNVKQTEIYVESGKIVVSKKYSTPLENGIIRCYVAVKNGKEEVPVDFTVKTKTSAILLNKSKIVLDALYAADYSIDSQNVIISTNITNSLPGADMYTYQVTMVGDKNNTDYSSHIDFIFWNMDKKEVTIRRTADTVSGKTYKVKISHPKFEKPATLTIKVKKSATPKLQSDKKEVTLNRILSNTSGAQTVQFSINLKDKPVFWRISKVIITSPTVKDEDISFHINFDDSTNRIGIETTNSTQKGIYNFEIVGKMIVGNMNDSIMLKPVKLKVKVVDKIPAIKLAKTSFTLNKSLTENDKVVINLPVGDYKYDPKTPWSVKTVKTKDGKNALGKLDYTRFGNVLTLSTNDNTKYNEEYQVVCTCNFANGNKKKVTFNVKIADKNAVVSAKGKSKGVIELARPNYTSSEIIYTFKNWNENLYTADGDMPVLEWVIYAKNGQEVVTTKDGALDDTGMVAKGSSADGVLTNGSWFKNVGYQANSPYKLKFMINNSSTAFKDDQIAAHYTYTVKTTVYYPKSQISIQASNVSFKVKNGNTKYAVNTSSVTLNKMDAHGRALITITDKNKDNYQVQNIAYVEVASDKKVPVSDAIEIIPLYNTKEGITYAIYWKDKTISNVKSGKVKLNIYLDGNNSIWKNPSATLNLKINVK